MTKNIHATEHHFGWDNSIAPKMVVQPGEKVLVETLDSSGSTGSNGGNIKLDNKFGSIILNSTVSSNGGNVIGNTAGKAAGKIEIFSHPVRKLKFVEKFAKTFVNIHQKNLSKNL